MPGRPCRQRAAHPGGSGKRGHRGGHRLAERGVEQPVVVADRQRENDGVAAGKAVEILAAQLGRQKLRRPLDAEDPDGVPVLQKAFGQRRLTEVSADNAKDGAGIEQIHKTTSVGFDRIDMRDSPSYEKVGFWFKAVRRGAKSIFKTGPLWYNSSNKRLHATKTGGERKVAKKKPLKKDRKAGSRPANAGPKKPFYQEIGAKRPQKKKPHPFGKGWELAEDFDRLEEGEYAARCTALDEDGNGIVQIEGVPFAVGGLLPGEEGTVAVSGRNKQRAQLVRVDKAVPERVRPRCPVFGRCGGCRLQHLSYDGQLELKQRTVEQLMQEYIAQGAKFYQILGMNEPWRYRNKAHATFSLDGRGRIVSGIYEESSHRVVPVERCLIQDERAEQIAASIGRSCGSAASSPTTRTGARGCCATSWCAPALPAGR